MLTRMGQVDDSGDGRDDVVGGGCSDDDAADKFGGASSAKAETNEFDGDAVNAGKGRQQVAEQYD